jgi:hypothetical protein
MTSKKAPLDPKPFQLAGMMNESGDLSRLMQARQYLPPANLRLAGRKLVWTEPDVFNFAHLRVRVQGSLPHDPELLFKFVKLAHASPEEILQFARRWGVLRICEHGCPYTHNPPPTREPKDKYWCEPMRNWCGRYYEPIGAWHFYSRQALAMLKIAANLHMGNFGRAEDWDAFYSPHSDGNGNGHGRDIGLDKFALTSLVNHWLELGNVGPTFDWGDDGPMVSLDLELFGVLASQLLMTINRTRGIGICSSCGLPFIPINRRPQAGRRNYCQSCRKRGAWRDAKAAQRRREKEGSKRPD